MDQVKAQMAVAAKYWFWIATALVTLLSVGAWWVSSSKLLAEFDTAKTKLSGDAQKISTVRNSLDTHPNATSHELMDKLVETRTDAVMEAWTSVYGRQRDILVWPVEELQEDFVREFVDLIPIELKVQFPTPEGEEKETSLRNRYRDYIGNVLPKIAEIAKTKWTADFYKPVTGMGGGMGMDGFGGAMGGSEMGSPGGDSTMYGSGGMPGGMGGTGLPRDDGPLVTWDAASQEKLLADLFPWRGGQPTTLDVLYSQENLWILRQLMQIIATVNGDAGQRFQAKIRGINRISIGRSVPTSAGTLSKPNRPGAASGSMGGMDGMMGGMEGFDSMGGSAGDMMGGGGAGMMGESGMGGMGGEAVNVDPGDNRYVDTAGTPVSASQLRAALSSNSPTDAFMAVAKRVPVMLTLKMDQRSLPELLAVCGSVPLMVEIKHVRILPPSGAGAVAASDGMSDMMGASGGMGAGMTGMGEGSGGGYGTMPTKGKADAFPLDMVVEVYGIIYIYNPPQADSLGIEKVDENTVIEGTALGEARVDDTGTAEPVTQPAPSVTPDPVPVPPAAEAPSDPAPSDPAPATTDPVAAPSAVGDPAIDPAAGAVLIGPGGLRDIVAETKFAFVFAC
ncbi:MAG TPA: hypothetical protein DDZ51_16335 [Planctomycetaceae bacterium]|nr:hypothetical protein [Planctomycetaceae bacterium]